jgi:hypothetical protein
MSSLPIPIPLTSSPKTSPKIMTDFLDGGVKTRDLFSGQHPETKIAQ